MPSVEKRPIGLSPETLEHLEPKIKPLVIAFNNIGIPTYSSCEGHLNATYRTRKLPYPWVTFDGDTIDDAQITQVRNIVRKWNETNPTKRWELSRDKLQMTEFKVIYFLAPETINFDLNTRMFQEQQAQATELARFIEQGTP